MTAEADVVVILPERLRGELKAPLGPVFADPGELLARVEGRVIAVGDIVTYHFEEAGVSPDVAIVDGRTKREAVRDEVRNAVDTSARQIAVQNPPGTLSADLLAGLCEALDADERSSSSPRARSRNGPGDADEKTVLNVDGEEDLAALAAILAAEVGASVVYGQPDEGMVHVPVTPETKAEIADLVARMDGNPERLFSMLGYDPD